MFLTGHLLLLAIGVSIHTHPSDALWCRQCTIHHPEKECIPPANSECNGPHEIINCGISRTYGGGRLKISLYGCYDKDLCGSKRIFPNSRRTEIVCCNNKDFCNENL